MDADIGVEHVSQHQRGSRSSAFGCIRFVMKSFDARGPSTNKSSQRFPTGLMIRLCPILMISTRCTPAGNATGLGKRTAWLRLLVKTVERVIVYPRCISQRDIHYGSGPHHKQDAGTMRRGRKWRGGSRSSHLAPKGGDNLLILFARSPHRRRV